MSLVEIIGILDDGPESLTRGTLRLVEQAQVLVGGERHLALFPDHPAERWVIKGSLTALAERIRTELDGPVGTDGGEPPVPAPGGLPTVSRRIVVLASGDPGFYGIAGYLTRHLGRDRIRIHPNVSAMALAFARARLSWDGATLHSVHGRSLDGLPNLVRSAAKIGIFTDEANSPAAIGRCLLEAGLTDYTAIVCENLGGPRERTAETDLPGLASGQWAPLNVLILVRCEGGRLP